MRAPDDSAGRTASSMLPATTSQSDAALFVWQGGGIVLIGEHADGRWVVARGWRGLGKLTDVRRWSFTSPQSFSGQVRRLSLEATGNDREARAAAQAASDWATALV